MSLFIANVELMIRLIVAILVLLAIPGSVHAQLLTQTQHGRIEKAAAVPPEIAGNTTLHFIGSSGDFAARYSWPERLIFRVARLWGTQGVLERTAG